MRKVLRMLWSEKYRNELADAYDKGYEEGYAKGIELAYRLASDGRGDEVFGAEGNPGKLRSPLGEDGRSPAKPGDAVRKSAV